MLYQLQSRAPRPSVEPRRLSQAKHPGDYQRQRLETQRPQLERYAREQEPLNPGLAMRARSLLMYLDGRHDHEIARATGITANAITRVRRRVAMWGLSCLADPPPRPSSRTTLHTRHLMNSLASRP